MSKVQVAIRAYNKDGYYKDILVMDEEQVRIQELRVQDSVNGPTIRPEDFPEMVSFVIMVREYKR